MMQATNERKKGEIEFGPESAAAFNVDVISVSALAFMFLSFFWYVVSTLTAENHGDHLRKG
jgi:hypothetical protein